MAAEINKHYLELKESYLFSEIARRIREWQAENPDRAGELIRMGIGDVTRPLPGAVVDAMIHAASEMGRAESFRATDRNRAMTFCGKRSGDITRASA